jgi:hypothetical protein
VQENGAVFVFFLSPLVKTLYALFMEAGNALVGGENGK